MQVANMMQTECFDSSLFVLAFKFDLTLTQF